LGDYSISLAGGTKCVTLEGLSRAEIEDLADLCMCLLFDEEQPYTWHYEIEPNDVY
jgi:hypothetical protein